MQPIQGTREREKTRILFVCKYYLYFILLFFSFALDHAPKKIQRKGKGFGGKGSVRRGSELKSKEQILKARHQKEKVMKRQHKKAPKGKGHRAKANKGR